MDRGIGLLQELWSGRHGVDDEVDAFAPGHTDLEQASGFVGTYQHGEVVKLEDADRVALGVHHVVVMDTVSAGAAQNHGFHYVKLS
jgi:hypothetical protein